MFKTIFQTILAALLAIPILDKWFSKSDVDKETEDRKQVDEEQDKNLSTKRPSNDFWDKRHL